MHRHVQGRFNDWLDGKPTEFEQFLYGTAVYLAEVTRPLLVKAWIQFALAAVFFLSMWWLFGSWSFAMLLTVAVYVHEFGHRWALHSLKISCYGIWFLPFLGAMTMADFTPKVTHWDRWLVMVMGPLVGAIPGFCLWVVLYYTGEWCYDQALSWDMPAIVVATIVAAKIVIVVAGLNGFNLLPLPFLDGSRMLAEVVLSLNYRTAIVFLLILSGATLILALTVSSILFMVLWMFFVFTLWLRWKNGWKGKRKKKRKSGLGRPMREVEILAALTVHAGLLVMLYLVINNSIENLEHWNDRLALMHETRIP